MSTPDRQVTILVPEALIPAANRAALTWDPAGGAETFRAPFLSADGLEPATHSACAGLMHAEVVSAVQAAVAARFPGVLVFADIAPEAALAQAGLVRVVRPMS